MFIQLFIIYLYIFTYLIIKKRVQIFLLHSLQHLQSYLLLLICCLYPNIPSIKKIKAIKISNITKINIIILVLLFFSMFTSTFITIYFIEVPNKLLNSHFLHIRL